ncbi:hypothetical protein [Halosegnis longus]|uniref:hypothetical protein n=1 Tax=Halosegnis longus TaxID=2216012 RepID=UPI001F21F5A4|nr:hypothetical protein [Halosegnis longus]
MGTTDWDGSNTWDQEEYEYLTRVLTIFDGTFVDVDPDDVVEYTYNINHGTFGNEPAIAEIELHIEVDGMRQELHTEMSVEEFQEAMAADHNSRRFELVRTEDVSGTSGTGVVAEGVVYPDGAVHMQWDNSDNEDLNTDSNGMATKPAPDGLQATKEIHGHDGATEIQFIDTDGEYTKMQSLD